MDTNSKLAALSPDTMQRTTTLHLTPEEAESVRLAVLDRMTRLRRLADLAGGYRDRERHLAEHRILAAVLERLA